MEQTAELKITAVTMADVQSLIELIQGFDFMILLISSLIMLVVGFFLGRSFLTMRSPVFDVRVKQFCELNETPDFSEKE